MHVVPRLAVYLDLRLVLERRLLRMRRRDFIPVYQHTSGHRREAARTDAAKPRAVLAMGAGPIYPETGPPSLMMTAMWPSSCLSSFMRSKKSVKSWVAIRFRFCRISS